MARYCGATLQYSYSIVSEPEIALVLTGPCQHKAYFMISTTELGAQSVLYQRLKRQPSSHLLGLVGYREGGGEEKFPFWEEGGRLYAKAPEASIPGGLTLIVWLTWSQKEFEATLRFPKKDYMGLQFD